MTAKTDKPEQYVDPQQMFQELFKTEKYREKISQFSVFGKKTLTVDFQDIYAFNQDLARMLLEKPEEYLRHAAKGAYEQLRIEDPAYAETTDSEDVLISICQMLNAESLRDLSADQLGKLVMVEGIVVRATPTQPLIREAAFKCKACGTITMVPQTTAFVKPPEQCRAPDCGKKGQYILAFSQEDCSFVDSQDLHVQERPEDLPPGQLPRTLAVRLVGKELVETARPGDHLSVVGIPKTTSSFNPGTGKPCRLNLQLEANSIEVLGKDPENSVTPQEQQKIVELSQDPWIHRKIVNSIAPSIYGYEYIKEAIMYLLFGGVTKHLVDITVRGEANILLIGDPGTAKSQLLQYIPKITPRGIYTSGKGSSLDYNENILIRRNGEVSFVKIGAFVESEQSRQLEASYVFPTLEALSLNVKSAKLEWKKITALQSHVCNDYVYTVKIETGRQVTTSKDHSIYVLKNSKIYPAAVENLKVGDCVLIPRSINQETRDFPADIARLIGYYIADGHLYKNKKHYANRLTFDFCEEKDGEYVADVMNILKKYLEQKYLPPSIQKVSGKISIAFQTIAAYEFMKNWLGETYAEKVHTKRIPNAILNSNSIARRNFVKGYFAGDGGTTVSKGLMSDLLYLYLQEGIIATSTYRKASNNAKIKGREIHSAEGWQLRAPKLYHPFESKEIYSRIPYDALNSVTLSKLQTEQDERVKTKFLRRKWRIFAERCQSLLEKDSKQLSVEWSISVRNVSQYLRKKAKAGLVVKVLNKYSLTENGKEEIEDFANLQRLINSDIGFAHICEILKVQPTKPLVYDLSVEGNENFVGGFGGIICHNSGVGLTAAVVKNKDSSLSLEAGAMVLADKGILMIDEFEKMKPEDRVAIHEAMEQHTVSVAKGGIVATLNARTSILAAANPVLGRYDPYKTVLENVSLPVTLLSRFDLIFIIKDVPDKAVDDLKAEHILQIHRTHASPIEPAISRPMLKKYIAYAKTIDPILSLGAMQHLKEFYLKMRSATDNGESPVAITARQLESLVRIAEARARVALRKEVSVEDAEAAIKIMQKSLEDVGIDSSSYKIDIDLIMTGKPKSARDKINAILTVVADLNKGSGPVSREEIIQQLEDKKIPISKQESEKLISQMLRESILYEPREGLISKT